VGGKESVGEGELRSVCREPCGVGGGVVVRAGGRRGTEGVFGRSDAVDPCPWFSGAAP
jgi:hypothetical protein